jgi:hypothetical protein
MPIVRRAIQESEEKNIILAKRYGVNRKTIAEWKARDVTPDERMGPNNRRDIVLGLPTHSTRRQLTISMIYQVLAVMVRGDPILQDWLVTRQLLQRQFAAFVVEILEP